MVQVAGGGDQQIRGLVRVLEVPDEHVEVHPGHRGDGALDRPAERVPPPERFAEDVVHQLVGRVLDHLDLFEDDLAFLLDLLREELGVAHDVRQEIDGDVEVVVEHLEVEAGVLLGREGVHLAAHRIDDERDVLGGARLRPLEMGDAVLLRRLVTRAALHPDPDGHRPQGAHRLRDQDQTVAESLLADVAHGAHGSTTACGGPRRTCRPSRRTRWFRSPGAAPASRHKCGW